MKEWGIGRKEQNLNRGRGEKKREKIRWTSISILLKSEHLRDNYST